MKRLVVAAVTISLSLAGAVSGALAQDKNASGITTNADGTNVTSTAGVNPTANGGGGTVIYGDITTGPGYTVISPPSVVDTAPPPETAPVPEPAPVTTDTTTSESTETTSTDTAVTETTETETTETETTTGSATDLDADNYPDELEWELGLDPTNVDTDADGVADGDEITIYGTDPTIADSDGDGVIDGTELYDTRTDPLLWSDPSGESTDSAEFVAEEPVAEEPAVDEASEFSSETSAESDTLAQGTNEIMTATDGNAAARGPGNASAAPGTVTRPGLSVLGPDGTYSVTDNTPSTATIAGDTEILAPPAAAPLSRLAGCGSYATWYDAQIAYEAAGTTSADPAVVTALDPDYDGIACEEGM